MHIILLSSRRYNDLTSKLFIKTLKEWQVCLEEIIFKGMWIYGLTKTLKVITWWSCWWQPKSMLHWVPWPLITSSRKVQVWSSLVRSQGKRRRNCAWHWTLQSKKWNYEQAEMMEKEWSFGAPVNGPRGSGFPSVCILFPTSLQIQVLIPLTIFISCLLIHN